MEKLPVIGMVGPFVPPAGGMARQTAQLSRLLSEEGFSVHVVRTNSEYKPRWIGGIPVLRALFRLIPFVFSLWKTAGNVQVFHVMANSGWSWYLFAAPAICIARFRRVPVVVNYRGGAAKEFIDSDCGLALKLLKSVDKVVVPSDFLKEVFLSYKINAQIIPNIIDQTIFMPRKNTAYKGDFHFVITRNLEEIYGIEYAIRAFAIVYKQTQAIRMTIAGSGSIEGPLRELVARLDLEDKVKFVGRLEVSEVAALYQGADAMLNPSSIDNMPNSVLEAMASKVPVISTNVGGVSYIIEHQNTGCLVAAGEPEEMAAAMKTLIQNAGVRDELIKNAYAKVRSFFWENVRMSWQQCYLDVAN